MRVNARTSVYIGKESAAHNLHEYPAAPTSPRQENLGQRIFCNDKALVSKSKSLYLNFKTRAPTVLLRLSKTLSSNIAPSVYILAPLTLIESSAIRNASELGAG